MNIPELAQAFALDLNAGNWDTVASYLSDDFQFSGPVPEPVGAIEWLGLNRTLQTGMPNMCINLQIVGIEGDEIRSVDQLSGTHTSALDLTPMGIGVIAATGRSVTLPPEKGVIRVRGGKIVAIELNTPADGGMVGLLAQLGVKPPQL